MPSLPVGLTAPGSRQGHHFAHVGTSPDDYPINLVCVNADMLPSLAEQLEPAFFEHRHTIGLWWWEASVFPERWHEAFDYVDELWAGSEFVAETLAAASPKPVVHMPMPVTLPPLVDLPREALGLPGGFVFLLVYDFASVLARKNPVGLIDAFLRAFPDPEEGARLVLKSINSERHPNEHDQVRLAAKGHPHVHLLDFYVSADEKNAMIAAADCYASLHRSEGFGITMAEAMLLGKPVVATAYSGNLDFMRPENSYLVDYELAPIGPGHGPYPPEAQWAEPDLDHAARLMREVFEDQEEARRRGETAADDIRRSHSAATSGQGMEERLLRIRGTLPIDDFDPTGLARSEAAAAQELVERGQTAAASSSRLRSAPRAAVLRLMKPHTSYEQQVDRGVTAALGHLGHALEALEGRLDALATRERESAAMVLGRLRNIDRRFSALERERLDELTRRVDELSGTVVGGPLSARRATTPTARRPAASTASRGARRTTRPTGTTSRAELDDAELLERFRAGADLPPGLGRGLDERVVEFPWLAAQRLAGRVLDAGSTLNHLHVLRRLRPRTDDLHIVTLAPEERAFPQLGVSYLYSRPARAAAGRRDLRPRRLALDARARRHRHELLRRRHEGGGRPAARAARGRGRAAPRPAPRRRLLHHRADRPRRALRLGALAHAGGARRDRGRVRARRVLDRLLPLRRRWVAALGSRGRGRRLLPRPLHERRRRPGRRGGRRGGRLPASRPVGLTREPIRP